MKILLVCNAGMSTGIMQLKLEEYAKEQGMDASIEAMPISEIEQNIEGVNAILLGPQVRFAEKDIIKMVNNSIPVFSIEVQDFGLMRADNVWNKLMSYMNKK
ncbi:Lichenan-specific phosphotransferase enzyme IIB component [Clostridium sp. C105KSO15]|nr:Lichenan-specific phosphotransferase enzyme IIB component [Clostridium sp. C105KSO15]